MGKTVQRFKAGCTLPEKFLFDKILAAYDPPFIAKYITVSRQNNSKT
jgi:hypothetical protein